VVSGLVLLPGLAELSEVPLEKMNYCLLVYFSGWFIIKMMLLGEDLTLPGSSYVVGTHELKDKLTRLIVCIVGVVFVVHSLLIIHGIVDLKG